MIWLFPSLCLAAGIEPEQATVPATGRQEVVVRVERFGRYAVIAQSAQGTAVQLVDRMSGPGPVHGVAGEEDGRIDAFLEAGETKVVLQSDPLGTGEAGVRVVRFDDPAGDPPRLEEARLVETTLSDLEQRAYWIDVPERRRIALELVGRHLEDVRLWRDGSWLVDASPSCDVVEPEEGRPQRRCKLSTDLEPGLYLATAYGGPGKDWAEASDSQPLTLRWGVPSLPTAGRRTFEVSSMGFDRWLVSEGADLFHVALPDNAPVAIAGRLAGADPLQDGGRTARITEESRLPVARVEVLGDGDRVVTVHGPIGQPYTLTWFGSLRGPATLESDGPAFVATLHAAEASDVPDPTAVVYRRTRDGRAIRSTAQALPLDSGSRVERTFNLLEPTRIVLDVAEASPYLVSAEGAYVRVVPYLTEVPRGYEAPDFEEDSADVDLGVGLHVLELKPREPGIVTLRIAHDSWGSWLKRKVGVEGEVLVSRPAIQFPALELEVDAPMVLDVMEQPGVPRGLVVRPLPVDPRDALPITLLPGEAIEVPITVREAGRITAATVDGRLLPVRIGSTPEGTELSVTVGEYLAVVRNDGDDVALASLALLPDGLRSDRPLPKLSPERLANLPDFPLLTAGRPASLDLDREQTETYRLRVAEDGLYRVQSTGLLATGASMRSRVRLGLASAEQNGIGRNFLVAGYLRSGDYQVTVGTRGRSRGHLGVALEQATILDGGRLAGGVPARITVPAGDAVRYTFEVAEAGRYRLDSQGQGSTFRCRVEDAGAWPLAAPDDSCAQTLDLQPGTYAVIGLPSQVETRRVTTLQRVEQPVALEGHGPHPLPIGVTASHTWLEPTDGGERAPDVWVVDVPAPIAGTVTLSDEMAGELVRDGESLGRLVPGQPWTGLIPMGRAELHLRGARRGTGVPYTVRVDSRELVAGTERSVSVSDSVPVAVGTEGVVMLSSAGATDVRGRLLDARGRLVAANDDRPDDWNFQLTARLEPGEYRLVLDPMGNGAGQTLVRMRAPGEVDGQPVALGEVRTVTPGDAAVRMSVPVPRGREVVIVEARSGENVGVAVEVQGDDGAWHGVGTASGRTPVLVARLPERGAETRVRVWSEDGRGTPAEVVVEALRGRRVPEAVLSAGPDVGGRSWGAVRLETAHGGLFELGRDRQGLYVCTLAGARCLQAAAGLVGVGSDGLILVRRGGRARASRIRLADTEERVARLASGPLTVDVADGIGPSLVTVRSSAGQPGAGFEEGAWAASERAALAVSLEGADRAKVWDAGDATVPLDARIGHRRLEPPSVVEAAVGRNPLSVPAGGGVALDLPGGLFDVEVALEAGLVAVTWEQRAVWADPGPVAARLPGTTRRVWVLNPGQADALAVVDVLAGAEGAPALAAGVPLERTHGEAGVRAVPVAADEAGVLRVAGAGSATLLRADGKVLRGDAVEVGPGGLLLLDFQPGAVLAWVEHPERPGPVRTVRAQAADLGTGGRLALSGEARRLRIDLGSPGVAHLRAPCPLVAEVEVAGGAERIEVLDRGGPLDLWLPEGRAEVLLRALSGTALYGEAVLASTEPLDIGEGLGPEVLLAPGGSRLFRFTVDQSGPIGVGVRATADRVVATVLDARGVPLGSGVVRQVELDAGTYFLRLSQPPDAPPVRARPALAGVVPPESGPPEDVVRRYLELAAAP